MSESWIKQRSGEEVAVQIRTVYMPRTPIESDDDWMRGWRAAVTSIAEFIDSDGDGA